MSTELQNLFLLVADICDSGVCYDMNSGGDTRYDGQTYGNALQEAYQNALHAEPASSWYSEALEANNSRLEGSVTTRLTSAKEIHEAIRAVDNANPLLGTLLDIYRALLAHQETLTTALLELQRGQFSSGRPSMSIETQAKLQEWQGEE